jgi:hypothetical protein
VNIATFHFLSVVCFGHTQHLIAKHYPKGKASYNRSLFDLARFQKIGDGLGMDPKQVQRCFEDRLSKL